MRSFLTTCCALSLFFIAGCSSSNEPEPVATTEDEFAAYDAMVQEMQEETAAEEAADAAAEGQ